MEFLTTSLNQESTTEPNKKELLYGINNRPPWGLSILLAIQQFLTGFSAIFAYPLVISQAVCIVGDTVSQSELMNTVIFVSGLGTLLQTTIGTRLPIIQGPSYAYITPIIVLMTQNRDQCPDFDNPGNMTLPFEKGSDAHKALWKSNLCEINGSLMVGALFQIIIGYSGLMSVLVRYIGPLTIAPVITLIGLSLFEFTAETSGTQWWICLLTVVLMLLFSECLNISIPFVRGHRLKLFKLFPVLFATIIAWLLCVVLTLTDVFPNQVGQWGYKARTDIKIDTIHNAHWFWLPYPGRWGIPTVTPTGVLGMIAASLASTAESIGDYYACARICGVKPPPGRVISRGIGAEGIAGVLAGAWGACGGSTSYTHNIAAISITKVGNRLVIQLVGVIMIILGCLGKIGALFIVIPDPIIGALYIVMFGMVASLGISNLQHVDLNSTRNLLVFGIPLFLGLCVPTWISRNPLDLGNTIASQVFTMLCGTNMVVAGITAFVLDNVIPGTLQERGILPIETQETETDTDESVYEIPFMRPLLKKIRLVMPLSQCPNRDKGKEIQPENCGNKPETSEANTTAYTCDDKDIPV